MYNLPQYLTKRDAWSATFEDLLQQRSTARTDAPLKLQRYNTHTCNNIAHYLIF